MIFIKITETHIKNAELLYPFKTLKNSISNGKGNVVGALGEILVCEYFNGQQHNTYDYDLIINGWTVEVKTKKYSAKLTPYKKWNAMVSDFNTSQKCDYYCFVGITDDFSIAYIWGFFEKDKFYEEATFGKKDTNDTNYNGVWKLRADCYYMPIHRLNLYIQPKIPIQLSLFS